MELKEGKIITNTEQENELNLIKAQRKYYLSIWRLIYVCIICALLIIVIAYIIIATKILYKTGFYINNQLLAFDHNANGEIVMYFAVGTILWLCNIGLIFLVIWLIIRSVFLYLIAKAKYDEFKNKRAKIITDKLNKFLKIKNEDKMI